MYPYFLHWHRISTQNFSKFENFAEMSCNLAKDRPKTGTLHSLQAVIRDWKPRAGAAGPFKMLDNACRGEPSVFVSVRSPLCEVRLRGFDGRHGTHVKLYFSVNSIHAFLLVKRLVAWSNPVSRQVPVAAAPAVAHPSYSLFFTFGRIGTYSKKGKTYSWANWWGPCLGSIAADWSETYTMYNTHFRTAPNSTR